MNELYQTYANSDIYSDNAPIIHSYGNTYQSNPGRTFVGWDGNTSIKSDFNRSDFQYFRSIKEPRNAQEYMAAGQSAYDKVGIIRNVVDLMADFASQGLKIEHPIPRYERLFNRWYTKVNGKDRSERFLNVLYRLGNVPVYRMYGKVNFKASKKMMSTSGEVYDDGIKLEDQEIKKSVIPLRYSFLNPMDLLLANTEISVFGGKKYYYLYVPDSLMKEIKALKASKSELLDDVPPHIIQSILKGSNKILIDKDRLDVYFYKKDDWNDWAKPMTSSIVRDIALLEQMKLADMAALDGAISNIRLWTIGWKGDTPNDTFIPTKAMIERVRNILAQNVGGGVMDLVWGPELSFLESKSEVYKFLGSEKYTAVLDAIYDGMGIPPTLRSGGGSTNTNNFMSLKTLVERLNYGRDVLTKFWMNELTIVQKALGITTAPTITFNSMSLSDETGEKKLLVELADRNIISDNTLLEKFNLPAEIEPIKVRREFNDRGVGLPEKAGPFFPGDKAHELKKIALTGGTVTPSQVGLTLDPKTPGEVPAIDKQLAAKKQQAAGFKPKGKPGRTKNVTETKKRKAKPKDVKTFSKAEIKDFSSKFLWANEIQNAIADIITPRILEEYKKPNVRSLTKTQASEIETLKYNVLFNLECFSQINEEIVYNILSEKKQINEQALALAKSLIDNFHSNNGRELTIDETRQIYATAYAIIN